MNYLISATTDIGNTKSTNQDSFDVCVLSASNTKSVFAVLCDGMGGLSKGEVASATLVSAFFNWAQNRLPALLSVGITDDAVSEEWIKLTTDYNEKIKVYGKKSGVSIGTTVTAMLITDERYYIINVGDTRAYELTDTLTLLTKDQTVVAREVELGNITPEQAKTDSRRSVLLQCIGASDSVYPDMFFGTTKKDAVYLLCSDGFRHEISEQELLNYLNPHVMISAEMMKSNTEALVLLDKQRQERDNITAITVRTY